MTRSSRGGGRRKLRDTGEHGGGEMDPDLIWKERKKVKKEKKRKGVADK